MSRIIRNMVKAKQREKVEALQETYNSADNFIFFGNGGKTATAAALSLFVDRPVLFLSPSGSASVMNEQFDNVISYQVDSLEELEEIVEDINQEFQVAKRIQQIIRAGDTPKLEVAKEKLGLDEDEWNEVLDDAKNGKMPISAVIVEECSVISDWMMQRCANELEMDVTLGEDKSKMG